MLIKVSKNDNPDLVQTLLDIKRLNSNYYVFGQVFFIEHIDIFQNMYTFSLKRGR